MKTGCCSSGSIYKYNKHLICINQSCENYLGYTHQKYFIAYWKKPIVIASITFFLLFSYDDFSMKRNENNKASFLVPHQHESITFSEVEAALKEQDIICRKEVLAQIKIESANLSSPLFEKTNNMLGMRYPVIRKTKASGIYIPAMDTIIFGSRNQLRKYWKMTNYAVYDSWKDGIADYKLWQDEYFKLTERYLQFIGNNYAEDPNYVNKIRQVSSIKKDNKHH